MTRNQKLLLTALCIYVIFDFILGNLISIFVWDKTKDFTNVLYYNLSVFISITFFSQVSAKLISKINSKYVYIFSIFLGVIQAGLLYVTQSHIADLIVILGIVAGASIGIQSVAYNIVAAQILDNNNSSSFISIKSSLMNTVSVVSIPVITYFIAILNSYTISYYICIISGILIALILTRLTIIHIPGQYQPLRYLKILLTDYDGRKLILTRFLYGLFNGPTWAIVGVITYKFVGNIGLWGLISTSFTLINIVGSYLIGRVKSQLVVKTYSAVSTIVFASLTIFLATNWNFVSFLGYQLGIVMLSVAFSNNYEYLVYRIINYNNEYKNHTKEIAGIGEVALGIGRAIPLLLLIAINFNLDQDVAIRILFTFIASIPVLIISALKNSQSFRYDYDILEVK